MANKVLNPKIEELFRWKGEVEITDSDGNVIETLYQRIIGDADAQKARTLALKESRLLRKSLLDENSDEALAHLPLKNEKTKDEMLASIVFAEYNDYRQQAEEEIREKKVKEPDSDANLEEQEQYVADLEEADAEREQKIQERALEISEKRLKELRKLENDEVYRIYVSQLIAYLCQLEFLERISEISAFMGTYQDPDYEVRRFESLKEFKNLSTRVKKQITSAYNSLSLGLGEVKK